MMRKPYSANVVLELAVAGQKLALSQVGPDFVILREMADIEPSTIARLDVIIDNRVATSREIVLPHGTVDGLKRLFYF